MPPEFYRRAIVGIRSLEQRHGIRIKNMMQSNLLALDDEKTALLELLLETPGGKRNVGTSYDPVPGIRVMKGGAYDETWEKSVNLLRTRDFSYGVVYVAHRRSLEDFDRVTGILLEKFPGVGVRFNPLYREGRGEEEACDELALTPTEWGEFLVKLYGLWAKNDKKPLWQPLKEWEAFHTGKSGGLTCDLAGRCGETHLGINADGVVFCCGRGMDRDYKPFGNIHDHSLEEILDSLPRRELANRSAYLRQTRCAGCAWWRYCHGGCPMDAALHNNNDIFHKTNFCASRRYYFKKIYKEPFNV